MKQTTNALPRLLNTLRLSLGDVAEGAKVSLNTADRWRSGLYRPEPATRKRLLRYVRHHAAKLLLLADVVEEEAKQRDRARARQRRDALLKS
jgi:transcriptional regulator with XRE-family HTH domain